MWLKDAPRYFRELKKRGNNMFASRWDFCRKIMDDPKNATCRLVFADWLDENGHSNAAQRQREWAKHVTKAILFQKLIVGLIFYAPVKSQVYRLFYVRTDGNISINSSPIRIGYIEELVTACFSHHRYQNLDYQDFSIYENGVLWIEENLFRSVASKVGIHEPIQSIKLKEVQG
jgi:uncharacterized protein (TIGR02996 family)